METGDTEFRVHTRRELTGGEVQIVRSKASSEHVKRQLEEVSKEQIETKQHSMKIIREQLHKLGEEQHDITKEFSKMERNSMDALKRVQNQFREFTNDINAEKQARLTSVERLKNEMQDFMDGLNKEREARVSGETKMIAAMRDLLSPLQQRVDGFGKEQGCSKGEFHRLSECTVSLVGKIEGLQEQLAREVRDRQAAEESLASILSNHRDTSTKELKDLRDYSTAHHDSIRGLRDTIDKHKEDYKPIFHDLHDQVHAIKKDFKIHGAQMPELESRIKSVEDHLQPQLREHKRMLDTLASDFADLSKKSADRVEIEAKAREGFRDDTEQRLLRMRKEMRERDTATSDLIQSLQQTLDKHKADTTPLIEELRDKVREMELLLRASSSQMSDLKAKVGDLQESWDVGDKEQRGITLKLQDELQKLRPQWTDLVRKVDTESAARRSLEESVHPQLNLHKKSIDRLLDEVGNVAKNPELVNGGVVRDAARLEMAQMINDLRNEIHDRQGRELRDLQERWEQSRPDRRVDELHTRVDELHRVMKPQVTSLHSRLNELEDKVHPQLQDHKKLIEKVTLGSNDLQGKLERRLGDLADRVDRESIARKSMLDDNDQTMSSFKNNVRSALNDHAEAARRAQDDCQRSMRDDLGKSIASFDERTKALHDSVSLQVESLILRLDELTRTVSTLERDAARGASSEQMRQSLRKVDDLAQQVADFRAALQKGLLEEGKVREEMFSVLESNIYNLEILFRDLGERILAEEIIRNPPRRCVSGLSPFRSPVKGLGSSDVLNISISTP